MTAEERIKARLIRNIGKDLIEGRGWQWRGVEYINYSWCGVSGVRAYVIFKVNFTSVKVRIETQENYGIPDKEEVFTGSDSMNDAAQWTANELYELYKIVSERTKPYEQGYENYLNALRGA